MKSLFLSLVSVFFVSGLNAQVVLLKLPEGIKYNKEQLSFQGAALIEITSSGAQKTTTIGSRLIAEANLDPTGQFSTTYSPYDSSHLYYSNGRGGDLVLPLKYDSMRRWTNNPNLTTPSYFNNLIRTQKFDAKDNLLQMLSTTWEDTFLIWENSLLENYSYDANSNMTSKGMETWSNFGWEKFQKDSFKYLGQSQVVHILQRNDNVSNSWLNKDRDSITYTSNGKILTHTTERWDLFSVPTSWDNYEKYSYLYDIFDSLVEVVHDYWVLGIPGPGSWKPYDRYTYAYDQKGNVLNQKIDKWYVSQNNWHDSLQVISTYDANNNYLTGIEQHWNNTLNNWDNIQRVVYAYNGANQPLTGLTQVWDPVSSSWSNYFIVNYSYDGNGRLNETVMQNWNGAYFQNYRRVQLTYNIFDQITSHKSNSWLGTQWGNVGGQNELNRFYYESYNPSAINSTSSELTGLSVYPSPTKGILNIVCTQKHRQSLTLRIFNGSGSLCRQWMEQAEEHFHKQLTLSGFPAGVYFLQVMDQQSTVTKSFQVNP